MRAWGNPSISKIMFAHIALLGFQRAGGILRQFLRQSFCLLIGTTNTIPRFLAFTSKHEKFSINFCHRATFGQTSHSSRPPCHESDSRRDVVLVFTFINIA